MGPMVTQDFTVLVKKNSWMNAKPLKRVPISLFGEVHCPWKLFCETQFIVYALSTIPQHCIHGMLQDTVKFGIELFLSH